MRRLKRLLLLPLVLLLLFEEWLWDHLKAVVARIARLPLLRQLSDALGRLPPWPSLAVLLLPAVVLLPFKLLALWALGHGHQLLGLLVFVAAKLCGTGLAAFLFDRVRDSARRLAWFDRLYLAITGLLARAHAWLHDQAVYRWVKALAGRWRRDGRSRWQRRLQWWRSRRP